MNDPKGWCGDPRRGAAMGRASVTDAPKDYDGKIGLRRVYLNTGGYDSNGTYFGHGDPLFWAANEDGDIDFMLRAYNRDKARELVLAKFPKAKVRR